MTAVRKIACTTREISLRSKPLVSDKKSNFIQSQYHMLSNANNRASSFDSDFQVPQIEPRSTSQSEIDQANVIYKYQDDEEEDEYVSESESSRRKSSSSVPTGSVLDKLQDFVESELWGQSRALMHRKKDSMIDNSSVEHLDANKGVYIDVAKAQQ